ncbi:MAG: hypothetical protein Q7S57_04875 [bacterium]|nr:hypothetical protein [bacterium]
MNKIFLIGLVALGLAVFLPSATLAQGMMGYINQTADSSVVQSQQQEEQDGKKFLDQLSQKTINCSQLTDDNFEKIGEYFMGQSIGDTQRHIVMNEMMQRMMGKSGEEQMHIVMGKRFSGCDTMVAFPAQDVGFMSMMNMMGGSGTFNSSGRGYNSMMNFGYSYGGGAGSLFTVIWWVLGIVGIIALVKWLVSKSHKNNR